MKIKTLSQQRKKTIAELEKEVNGLKIKLSETKINLIAKKESNLKAAHLLRRDIAQNLSIIGELKKSEKVAK